MYRKTTVLCCKTVISATQLSDIVTSLVTSLHSENFLSLLNTQGSRAYTTSQLVFFADDALSIVTEGWYHFFKRKLQF